MLLPLFVHTQAPLTIAAFSVKSSWGGGANSERFVFIPQPTNPAHSTPEYELY